MSPFPAGFSRLFSRLSLVALLLPHMASIPLYAKTAGLTAIEIYPAGDGQQYQQIADFILNGKNEVYLCLNTSRMDKSAYRKLTKVLLVPGMSLERDAKGFLMLSLGEEPPACVVPGNIKFEGSGAYDPAELADKAATEGKVLSSSDASELQVHPIKQGVKIVLVASPDLEFAEYLRAERAGDIESWKRFLGKSPSGAHTAKAGKALAALYLKGGNGDLDDYNRSKDSASPDYAKLKSSRQMAQLARSLVPDDAATAESIQKIHAEVISLSSRAKEQLDIYRAALQKQAPGYASLVAAEQLADAAFNVEPSTAEAADLEAQSKQLRASFDGSMRQVEGQIAAHRADEAAQTIHPLVAFAGESPEIASDLQAISGLYLAHAKKLEETPDWPEAVKELEKANANLPRPETQALLEEARRQAQIAADKSAAEAATQKSKDLETGGDLIRAYEVLDDLPADQRTLVSDRLDSLKGSYLQAADLAAKGLQKAHEPINGYSDEVGIQTAYKYLQRCLGLSSDPTLRDRLSILGDDLSVYYLQQGKKYTEKPDGTGVNVGWSYLSEALKYKSQSNLGAIHDEMTTARAAYLLKSRLSVKVDFRDQTSRREAVDFAVQLTDALATGMESAGLQVKVVRPQEHTVVQPNFQLVGDVLRHEMGKSQSIVAKESAYRSGEEQIPNEVWNRANRDYERANNELQSARSSLVGSQARGKKNEIKSAEKVVADATKNVEELHAKLDMIPKTKAQDVERPYSYSQVIYHLRIAVELQFRILDSSGNEVVKRIQVRRETPQEYSVLQNVKPEDTKGVRSEGVLPNDNDFFEADEDKARDNLIEKAKGKVAELPDIVLQTADHKAADGDNDGAAELYILYLNSTKVADTSERNRARKFLVDQYNFKDIGKEAPSE